MSDTTTTTGTDAATTTTTDAGSGGNGASGAEDVTGLKTALATERENAKRATKELKTLQTRLTELEGKDKSDVERLTGERDKLLKDLEERETRLRTLTARDKVQSAATKANAIEPAALFKLVRDDLTYDDDGEPTNVDAAIAATKKDYPAMFRAAAGSGDGGRGGDGKTNTDPNALVNSFLRAGRTG